jgi:predicted 3-demethylubiquinone-9 3-methyltransferase (glyoxalase superfamily)
MTTMQFSIEINASPERVWQILWDDSTYREWTAPFMEGSYAESDWVEGGKVLFLSPGGEGMVSRIAKLVPNEFMSFEHLGYVRNGVEDFEAAQKEGWAGACENYTIRKKNGGVELIADLSGGGDHVEFLKESFPIALGRIKQMSEDYKISPFLWFDHQAEAAANFYVSVFPGSEIRKVIRQGEAVFTVDFSLAGQRFSALNGGPMFQINPSISFFVVCETESEIDAAWQKLSEGGAELMPLNKYDWSEKYGWVQDRFGLSWQLSLGKIADTGGQKFTPSLLFVGEQSGRAEDAVHFYTSVFKNADITGILKYGPGEALPEGVVKHAQFSLERLTFMIMDGGTGHPFQFNEALSFVVSCDTQEEIDYYWSMLTAGGGQESQCGWLKDKFGVSWQIVPPILIQYLNDPDPQKAGAVMQAMLKMRKIDIGELERAAG